MAIRKLLYIASAIVVFALLATSSTGALNNKRTTYLTFSGPFTLPGVTLPAGTYTFDLPAPDSSLQLVRVSSRDGTHVYFTAVTNPIERPASVPWSQLIVFGEAPTHVAPPVTAWFSQDERTGRQFIY